jgi:UDP-2,4-diacetamido-2,4,6-trideoxy-beta-L-altropyranose hydrolase
MTIFFRLDEFGKTGNGHLVRCLTLAKEIAKQQSEIVFICAEVSEESASQINLAGFILERISTFEDEINDAQKVTEVLKKYTLGIAIVDHYGLNIEWNKIVFEHVKKLIVIDDLINRPFYCHLLISPNCFHTSAYNLLVPEFCELLLGPEFVFIKPEYIQNKKSSLKNSIDRILIFMGGADSKNVTSKLIVALSENEFNSIHLDIVIGTNNSNKLEIDHLANERGNFTLYFDRPHLADLMNTADLSIGAGGNTAWERVCVGLPSFIITLADNQVPLANYLNNLGFVSYIGNYDIITNILIQNSIRKEIKDGQLRKNFNANKNICDGMGVSRVAKRISLLTQ